MDKLDQKKFIQDILDNWPKIMEEYNNVRRTNATPGFDKNATPQADWRCITLWWYYRACNGFQKQMPFTTKLIEHGPTHYASGWLMLNPHSSTPVHNHKDWGHKIIVHFPTYIPEGDVGFNVEGQIYRWKMGEVFAFDCEKTHFGFNNTDEQRSMMVLDFDYDEWYDTLRPYMHLED